MHVVGRRVPGCELQELSRLEATRETSSASSVQDAGGVRSVVLPSLPSSGVAAPTMSLRKRIQALSCRVRCTQPHSAQLLHANAPDLLTVISERGPL